MTENIVAMYDQESDAEKAVRDLQAAGVPASAISRHGSPTTNTATGTTGAKRDPGFWQSLFGGEPGDDAAVYEHGTQQGSHLVSVQVPEEHVQAVTAILERYNPVDLDDRAKRYGIGQHAEAAVPQTPGRTVDAAGIAEQSAVAGEGRAVRGGEEVLRLGEEALVVGKRLVNRGTTRIRRFVTETPVQQDVSLHAEAVTIERRPVTGDATIANPDFADRTLEVTESDEEAVVSKTARVREEVVVRKQAADRTETVRDTVRREDVEITKDGTPTGAGETLREAAADRR